MRTEFRVVRRRCNDAVESVEVADAITGVIIMQMGIHRDRPDIAKVQRKAVAAFVSDLMMMGGNDAT